MHNNFWILAHGNEGGRQIDIALAWSEPGPSLNHKPIRSPHPRLGHIPVPNPDPSGPGMTRKLFGKKHSIPWNIHVLFLTKFMGELIFAMVGITCSVSKKINAK